MKYRTSLCLIVMMLALSLLCGCQNVTPSVPESSTPQTPTGEGISPLRTGLQQQSVTSLCNGFECTDQGFYALCDFAGKGSYLVYADHDSDTVIKLCSRPDCTHDDENCNAYFAGYTNVCYFDGHLYLVSPDALRLVVTRIDLDGRNRTDVLDTMEMLLGYRQCVAPVIMNGTLYFTFISLDDAGNEEYAYLYYKLDGSMAQPEPGPELMAAGNDGNTDIFMAPANDGAGLDYYTWTPESGNTFLVKRDEETTGYYCADHCYQMIENIIYRIDYATGVKKLLLDTGLTGTHRMRCFPEFIVVMDATPYFSDEPPLTSQTLRFYNWNFELVDTLTVDYPISIIEYSHIICGETPNRFLLCSDLSFMPRWYIEKSEIGSGNLTIHPYNTPADLVWEE